MKELVYNTVHCTITGDTANINSGGLWKNCVKNYTPNTLEIIRHGKNDVKKQPEKKEKTLKESVIYKIERLLEDETIQDLFGKGMDTRNHFKDSNDSDNMKIAREAVLMKVIKTEAPGVDNSIPNPFKKIAERKEQGQSE